MKNLISELHSIEQQADQLLQEARTEAKRIRAATPERIAALEAELERQRQSACEERRKEVEERKRQELQQIATEFQSRKKALENISEATIASFADKVVQKLKGQS